ncbi:hypothetical protein JMJ35_010152 [Cladonia borealis]|uniref:Glucose-methanol-choline oxidoreductase N-terminal domain-containing protein n=1 Tax=Cladonia borealis TaxID=184061 RepID=A0AA39V1Q0_9LECA|nr:hypothetical protein JMJ35_010152 [Cladonia borealis]
MSASTFDFIIAGGGTVGCTLASRLSLAGYSVAVFEAGPEDYSEKVMSPLAAPSLHGTPLEYDYLSQEQPHLANRRIKNSGGCLLSGSSATNYANWTRCHSADYDAWAHLVGSDRWSYRGLLKYFKKSEHHHDPSADPGTYGFNGPIYTTAGARQYPLRDSVREALSETGLRFNAEPNGGCPLGYGPFTENWKDGKRQPAGKAYDLSEAAVFTRAVVKRVMIDAERTAVGIELLDGRTYGAVKEVLVCCGSIKTPQLLMLSGIGPSSHLSSHGIPVTVDLPVGQNLHDHLSATLYWKLKHPEWGLAIGSPNFMKPEFRCGNPIDWIATESIADPSRAVKIDKLAPDDLLIRQPRGHVELFVSYAPIAAPAFFEYSLAGTHISTPVLGLLPTSRGFISLASRDASAAPIIDPNYLDTEMDREAVRTGIRSAVRMMLGTPHGQSFVEEETPPPGQPRLSLSSSDQDIDRRIQVIGRSFYQCAGTAAMGKVVDTDLRVNGIRNLRVVDASILPLPLAGHYQCPMYAIAESAADLILKKDD